MPTFKKLNKFINVTFIPFAQGNVSLKKFNNQFINLFSFLLCFVIHLNVVCVTQYYCYCFQITVNPDQSLNITCKRDGECAADRVHACGIHKIKDSEQLIKFVNCSLSEGYNSPNKTVPIDLVYAFV